MNTNAIVTNVTAIDSTSPLCSWPTTLLIRGYVQKKFISDSLQGDICIARCMDKHSKHHGKDVVIKRTSKILHRKRCTVFKGEQYSVEEDIVREAQIMYFLCKHKPPSSMIEIYDFIEDDSNYYLIMEYGGTCLFDFVTECHLLIKQGKLSLNEWRYQCKFMFAQMIQFLQFMHSKGFVNLDISMENMLISHDCFFDEATGELHNGNIKFIDFGLSEYFPGHSFECNKFVGKTRYKAPEVYARRTFDAIYADIWSLGVVFLSMMSGLAPYEKPCMSADKKFKFLMQNGLRAYLVQMDRLKYLTKHSANLIQSMLQFKATDRITLDGIMRDPFLKVYFVFKKHAHTSSSDNARKQRVCAQTDNASQKHRNAMHVNSPSLKQSYSDLVNVDCIDID